jgi:hypothetical protein
MLRSINELHNYTLLAEDGEIGRCKDFLFDDRYWAIRYMVADTRKWLPGRKVLISPISLKEPRWANHNFPVRLNKKQIQESPPLSEDEPVSKQFEKKWFQYYGWQSYWAGTKLWGPASRPTDVRLEKKMEMADELREIEKGHLRSIQEVTGYDVRAADGLVGSVEDFIVDDGLWVLRYVIVDTQKFLPGRKVLIDPRWGDTIDWFGRKVNLNVLVKTVEESPEYDPSTPISREQEVRLYDFYGRPKYWL